MKNYLLYARVRIKPNRPFTCKMVNFSKFKTKAQHRKILILIGVYEGTIFLFLYFSHNMRMKNKNWTSRLAMARTIYYFSYEMEEDKNITKSRYFYKIFMWICIISFCVFFFYSSLPRFHFEQNKKDNEKKNTHLFNIKVFGYRVIA